MIKNIRISNFKSLRETQVDLGKFNVLIGPNASGKSNFLDCLNFVSQTTQGNLNFPLAQRGGYHNIVFGGQDENEISIILHFLLNNEEARYQLTLSPSGFTGELLDKYLSRDRNGNGEVTIGNDRQHVVFRSPFESGIATYGDRKPLRDYRDYFQSWKLYKFETAAMRSSIEIRKNFDLTPNGSNLAQVLHSLHTERLKLFYQIENILKQAIPVIKELIPVLTQDGRTFLSVKEEPFDDYHIGYLQLSDGTLRLLAYIVAISSVEPKLACFEEPENFVHPRMLELLVEVLKKSDKQVILSTHSPYLLNFVEPEDVLIFEKRKGETNVKRIENMQLIKKHLAEIGLGELWYSGDMGGVP